MSGVLERADGTRIDVVHGLTIGRHAACGVRLDDTKASRRHAQLIVEVGVVEVEDLGSSNGTKLNGKPITRRVLRDGDKIQIGKTTLTYREGVVVAPIPAAPGAAAPPPPPPPAAHEPEPGEDLLGDLDDGGPDAGDVDVIEFVDEVVEVARDEPAAAPLPPPPERPSKPAPVAPPPPPDDDGDIIEFVDEVVEVKRTEPEAPPLPPPPPKAKPAPAPAPEPRPEPAPKPAAPDFDDLVQVRPPERPGEGEAKPEAATGRPGGPAGSAARPPAAAAGGGAGVAREHGVLQFSKNKGKRGGLLGDDVAQVGGLGKILLIVVGLAIAGGVAWLAMQYASDA